MFRTNELRRASPLKCLVTALLTCVMVGLVTDSHAQRAKVEDARITGMGEDYIHVSALSGDFVLEPMAPCNWCTVGMEVHLTLRGYTTAKLKPKPRTIRARPVRAFIVKDGRFAY
ncbi:MAG: hypothetical protein RDU20_10785 [Desulfomonilaceae bacterium]|nr:hypothetical protein [Desulfomonilaceae bacterium]